MNKIIKWESEATEKDSKRAAELEKISKKYAEVQNEKLQNYESMIKHIKTEKILSTNVERKVDEAYSNLEMSSQQAVEQLMNNTRIYNQKKDEEKNVILVFSNIKLYL